MKSRKIPNFLDLNNMVDGGASHLNWRKGLGRGYFELWDESGVGACVTYKKRSLVGRWLFDPEVLERGLGFGQSHSRFFYKVL